MPSVLSEALFHNEIAAFGYVEDKLWPHGPVCPGLVVSSSKIVEADEMYLGKSAKARRFKGEKPPMVLSLAQRNGTVRSMSGGLDRLDRDWRLISGISAGWCSPWSSRNAGRA